MSQERYHHHSIKPHNQTKEKNTKMKTENEALSLVEWA